MLKNLSNNLKRKRYNYKFRKKKMIILTIKKKALSSFKNMKRKHHLKRSQWSLMPISKMNKKFLKNKMIKKVKKKNQNNNLKKMKIMMKMKKCTRNNHLLLRWNNMMHNKVKRIQAVIGMKNNLTKRLWRKKKTQVMLKKKIILMKLIKSIHQKYKHLNKKKNHLKRNVKIKVVAQRALDKKRNLL